jgi:predicted GNAT family acetyltransferase
MQKVEHMTKEELVKYGTLIGEAFVLEGDGIATTAPKEDIVKAFEIMTEYFYKSGVLYTTSDDHEGFLAYWRKNTKVKIKPMLHMIFRMLREMSFKGVMAVASSSGELYAKLYKKEKDYVAVSMVVVLREFQGKGYMKKVLEHPFAEADQAGIPCVLDTDTKLKREKYTKCGMRNTGEKKLKSGQYLYTMEYRGK